MKHVTQISIDFLHNGGYDPDRLEKLISLALFEQGCEFLGVNYESMGHAYPEHLGVAFETFPDMFTDYENMIENENYDNEVRIFTVPEDWVTDWIRRECNGMTLSEFNDVYDYDGTYQMYLDACIAGVLIEEHIEEVRI